MPGDTAEQGVMDGDFSIGKHAEWRCDVICADETTPPDPKQSPLVVVAFTPRAGYMRVQ